MQGYFEPAPGRDLVDKAALIVALVQGRESATRTDYAHPKMHEIQRILEEVAKRQTARGRIPTP